MPGSTPNNLAMESLVQLIQSSKSFNSSETAAYLFCNSRCNRLRILYWDTQWFLDLYLPIQNGRLKWPMAEVKFMEITLPQLQRLLQGDTLNPSVTSFSLT